MPRSRTEFDVTGTEGTRRWFSEDDRLRIALYAGIWVRHDGISNSLGLKVDLFDRLAAEGYPITLTVFVQGSDSADPRVRGHGDLPSLLADPAFRDADVHMFEFGIAYALFDALMLTNPRAVTVGTFHNVTPPELAASPAERRNLERSLRQRNHLAEAHHVMCDSEFNRQQLLDIDLDPDRLSVVHLPYERNVGGSTDAEGHEDAERPVRFIYVGRLVPAKGIPELLAAARSLVRRGVDFRLLLASKREFADPEVAETVERLVADPEMDGRLELVWDADDARLTELYRDADSLVLPSHHEGFCLPVIEAFAHDCFVIASDAGNLPFIVGDCGRCVPVGDDVALADAMDAFASATTARLRGVARTLPLDGGPSFDRWRRRVDDHLAQYTQDAFERGVLRAVARAIEAGGKDAPDWLEECLDVVPSNEEATGR